MPKGTKTKAPFDLKLFEKGKVRAVKPEAMAAIRATAMLGGIPPVVSDIAKRLLEHLRIEKGEPGGGEAFELATPELKAKSAEVLQYMLGGMRKVVKTLGPGGLTAKGVRRDDDLVFWLARSAGGTKKKP